MEIFDWLLSILVVGMLIYAIAKPFLGGLDYSKLKHPDFSIQEEEEVLEKPAPKKRRPYKKRKPKNATTEKKGL